MDSRKMSPALNLLFTLAKAPNETKQPIDILIKQLENDEIRDNQKLEEYKILQRSFPEILLPIPEYQKIINTRDSKTNSLLIYAAKNNHVNFVKLFIESKCDVDQRGEHGKVALHWAVGKNYLEIIDLLINANAHLDMQSTKGDTPLSWAAFRNHTKAVKKLIEARSQLDIQNNMGDTAIHHATANNNLDMVNILIKAKCRLDLENYSNHPQLNPPIKIAIENNFYTIIDQLIVAGSDLNFIYKDGLPLLHYSILDDNYELTDILIRYKYRLDINIQDSEGNSALHCAVKEEDSFLTNALIQARCNLDMHNLMGDTTLHQAAKQNNHAIVTDLIEARCDVNVIGEYNNLPLHWAVNSKNLEMVKKLVEAKSEINHRSVNGDTPLSWSANCNTYEICEYLINIGAKDLSAELNHKSALDYAVQNKNMLITELLCSSGSEISNFRSFFNFLLNFDKNYPSYWTSAYALWYQQSKIEASNNSKSPLDEGTNKLIYKEIQIHNKTIRDLIKTRTELPNVVANIIHEYYEPIAEPFKFFKKPQPHKSKLCSFKNKRCKIM